MNAQLSAHPGLPLILTLALAFATKRMTHDTLLVRVLSSCETMTNASVICTDKTGAPTPNSITVVAGSVGVHCKFFRGLKENSAIADVDQRTQHHERHFPDDFSIDQSQLNTVLPPPLRTLFNEAIAVNTTAFEDFESGMPVFVGSKTEAALLQFVRERGWSDSDYKQTRNAAEVIQTFSGERESTGIVVRRKDGGFRLYLKGASEVLSRKCTTHVAVTKPMAELDDGVIKTAEIDEEAEENIARTNILYANQSLKTIALCYRDFDSWPPEGMGPEENQVNPTCHL